MKSEKNPYYLILVFLFLFFTLSLAFIDFEKVFEKNENRVGAVSSEKNSEQNFYSNSYKSEFRAIFDEYNSRRESEKLDLEYVRNIERKILEMKVPVDNKDEHLKMALSLKLMIDYLNSGDYQDRVGSEKIINDLKSNYSWLR